MPVEITYGAKTDVGLKRSHNEDNLTADPALGLFVVCDGMGGRNAGEVASGMAVELIRRHVQDAAHNTQLPIIGAFDAKFSPRTNRLASAVRLANQVVHEAGKNGDRSGMGTTVVSALVTGPVVSVAHLGDSRLYLIRDETIQQVTEDHSLVAEQVRRGILTEEEAEQSHQKNIVTRALGIEPDVEVALDELPLLRNDVLVLCSDGLTRGVKPAEILQAVRAEPTPQAAAERLVTLANDAGGDDNTTVIVIALSHSETKGFFKRLWGGGSR